MNVVGLERFIKAQEDSYEISQALLDLSSSDAREVMGYPDDMKLRFSMTLFYLISRQNVFMNVLEKFFDGEIDWKTADIIKQKV